MRKMVGPRGGASPYKNFLSTPPPRVNLYISCSKGKEVQRKGALSLRSAIIATLKRLLLLFYRLHPVMKLSLRSNYRVHRTAPLHQRNTTRRHFTTFIAIGRNGEARNAASTDESQSKVKFVMISGCS